MKTYLLVDIAILSKSIIIIICIDTLCTSLCPTHCDIATLTTLQSKLTRQVAQAPGDLGCVCIAPYDITHGFMVSYSYS